MWNQAPFAALLFLAGMQSVSVDLYSAAEVDGAGYWQRFRYVTLPAIRPIMFLVLVLATVNGFLMLDLIYVLTMGGPANETTTISWLGFQTAFSFFKFGPGHGDPVHPDRPLPAGHGRLPAADPRPVRARGLSPWPPVTSAVRDRGYRGGRYRGRRRGQPARAVRAGARR